MISTSVHSGSDDTSPAGHAGTDPRNAPLIERIAEEIDAGRIELPVQPEVAVRVREIVSRGGTARDLVAVIEREPSLAAAILRYANSAMFAGLREVTDLSQAAVRLGLRAVETTVVALSARATFNGQDPALAETYRALWRHSITTAAAARRLASRGSGLQPEVLFLAGLLHDVGKVIVLRCATVLRQTEPRVYTFAPDALHEFLDALHCRAGDHLCGEWNLPAEIRDVVRRHHDAELYGPEDSLVAIVQLASAVATRLGANLHPDSGRSLLELPGSRRVRLDDVSLAELLVDVEDDVDRLENG
jgi:putative nucleotidyltransferase with HDIG domain